MAQKVVRPKSSYEIYFYNKKYIYLMLKNKIMYRNNKKKILPLLNGIFSHM